METIMTLLYGGLISFAAVIICVFIRRTVKPLSLGGGCQ